MGAWGSGVFENDDASDWVWELEDDTDGSVLVEALSAVTDADPGEVDAPDACNALAAAEIVAAARGKRSVELPAEAEAWLAANTAAVDDRLVALAVAATARVADDSELKDLWDEAGDSAWAEGVAALLERLR